MAIIRACLLAWCATILSACTMGIGPDDDQLLRTTYLRLSAGDFDAVEQSLDTSLRTPATRQTLEQVRAIIHSAGTPCERSLVHASTTNTAGSDGVVRQVVTQHKYVCADGALLVEARLRARDGSAPLIEHYYLTPFDPAAAAAAQSFDIEGKSPREYAFLAASVLSPLLMLTALLGVIFTREFRRKWLWGVISLVGFPRFFLNWSTDEISAQWFSINLLGFGVMRSLDPFAPWIVSFTAPIGAVVVLSMLWPRWAGLAPSGNSP